MGTRRTPNEWVIYAEKLAKQNGGLLPYHSILNKNGHRGLITAMRRHGDLFINIKCELTPGSPIRWVSDAEELAQKHGGILPHGSWLRKNNHGGLHAAMLAHPNVFSHINQDSCKGKTLEEWVAVAENLAEEHGGILPCCTWRIENISPGFDYAIRNNPDYFDHIKMDTKRKSPEDWITIVEKFAGDHGGILPNRRWLCDNGHSDMDAIVYRNKHLFSHIKQDSKTKTLKEWVSFAEDLALSHGGVLPYKTWLMRNGYGGLTGVMYPNLDMFDHIKQERGVGGFNPLKTSFLYVIVFNSGFIKVGITNDFDTRINALDNQKVHETEYKILDWYYYEFECGGDAEYVEATTLNEFKPHQYTKLLDSDFSGRTELLHKNVYKEVTDFINELIEIP